MLNAKVPSISSHTLAHTVLAGYSFVRTEGYVNASQWSDANSAMDSLQIFFNAKVSITGYN